MLDRVRVDGLSELDRALGEAGPELRKDLRRKLKDLAEVVAVDAREKAASRNHRRSGDLVRGIQPFANLGVAGVRSTAVHRGYEYPRRLEWEGGPSGEPGPRASLYPAFEEAKPLVLSEVERILESLAHDW